MSAGARKRAKKRKDKDTAPSSPAPPSIPTSPYVAETVVQPPRRWDSDTKDMERKLETLRFIIISCDVMC